MEYCGRGGRAGAERRAVVILARVVLYGLRGNWYLRTLLRTGNTGSQFFSEVFELVYLIHGLLVGMSSDKLASITMTEMTTGTGSYFFNASTARSVISRPLQINSHLTSSTSSNSPLVPMAGFALSLGLNWPFPGVTKQHSL